MEQEINGERFLASLLQRNENRGRFVVFYAFLDSEGGKLTRKFLRMGSGFFVMSWKRKIIKANEIGKLFNDIKIKH